MTGPIDTIREALPDEHYYGDDDNGSPFHRDDCPLCALTEVEQQLAAYQLEFDETGKCLRLCTPEAQARLEAAETALRAIAQPNWGAKPTGQDARDMADFARAALDRQEGS